MTEQFREVSWSYLPLSTSKLLDEDDLASIFVGKSESGERHGVGWAVLYPTGCIRSGFIQLENSDLPTSLNLLNAEVGQAIIDREAQLGLNPVESLYEEARVQPTWRRLRTENYAVLNWFSIQIGKDCRFSAYYHRPFCSSPPPAEERARAEMTAYRRLRLVSRLFEETLSTVGDQLDGPTESDGWLQA